MRKGMLLAAAALIALSACGKEPDPVSVANSTEAMADNLADMANQLEAQAAGTTDAEAQAALGEAAATFDNGAQALGNDIAAMPGND